MFVVKNRDLFKLNSDIHGFSTRYDNDFVQDMRMIFTCLQQN